MKSQVENGRARNEELGDFTTTWRVLPISLLAIGIGVLCAYVALALLRLIGLFTNLFYFGRWSTAMVSPVGNHLGVFSVLQRPKYKRFVNSPISRSSASAT